MDVAVEYVDASEVLAGLSEATVVADPGAWSHLHASLGAPTRLVTPTSLEELDLERLWDGLAPSADGPGEPDIVDGSDGGDGYDPDRGRLGPAGAVVGIGGGLALDTAKYLALRAGLPVVLVPTALASLAPFTTDVARRVRRQVVWSGEVESRVVVDLDLIATAPAPRNRAGAAEIVGTTSATWDWHLADARDRGLPFSTRLADLAASCRDRLGQGADEVAATTPDGLALLAGLLAELGAACADSGHRRLVDGSEHTFVQAYEHRLGRPHRYGDLVGLGTVTMATLQSWYGVSAGGTADPEGAIDLLTRCKVAANPHQLGLDEGTFRGLLRHAVRFHVGEFLPWSVLNEADLNWSASEEMWRRAWQVPVVRETATSR